LENVSLNKKIKDKLPTVLERMIDNRMKPFIENQINHRKDYGLLNKKDIKHSDLCDDVLKNMLNNKYEFKKIEVSNRACLNLKGRIFLITQTTLIN
jgi:hypothetical protein